MSFMKWLCRAAAVFALAAPAWAAVREPIVSTTLGQVAGKAEDRVEWFKGVPYAAAPIGQLRWRPTAAHPGWKGVRPAKAFGPKCVQPDYPPPIGSLEPMSEDCLTLNIWKPARVGKRKLPVLVWIHGGAFVLGSGSHPHYDGSALARNGVVVVTFNYRLGALGFLAHPAMAREQAGVGPGNFGLLDQIAALHWIRGNISRFGGDSSNVTLMGESSGAVSVTALMTSPLAEGLFAKAVSQSGGGTAIFPRLRGVGSSEAAGRAWSEGLGLRADASMADLRALSVEAILKRPFFSFPSIDGSVLKRSPGDAFRRGEQVKIPLLIGANSFEASLVSINDDFARLTLRKDYDTFLADYRGLAGDDVKARAALRGELFFVQPARFMAASHAALGAATYLYHFAQVPSSDRATLQGSPHGGEIAYIFSTPGAAMTQWDTQDRQVSELVIGYWTRFAKTGNPNFAGAPRWRRMVEKNGAALRIAGRTSMVAATPLDNRMRDAAVASASNLWGP